MFASSHHPRAKPQIPANPPLVVRERFSEGKPKAILACNLISEIPAEANLK